jgi:L-ascorbate metabolism protein UlaG (beta-lactamase superfamily)
LLVEIDGARFLTDPVWGERASPLAFAGPRRFHRPPVSLDALPALDGVIISHDHYDHLDRNTIRALAYTRVPIITSLGVGAILEQWGIAPDQITELDWWESTEKRGVVITAAPAQHFSGRGIRDRNATLWSSFRLQGPGHAFFYGADSGLTPEFAEIAARLGPFDAVALEVGAHHPAWGDIHLGPEGAMSAWQTLGGRLLPIHWGTFNLALHPWDEPIETLLTLAGDLAPQLLLPRFGEPIEPSESGSAGAAVPWWRQVTTAVIPSPSDDRGLDTPVTELPD